MENTNFARVLPCFYPKISLEESEKFVNLLFFGFVFHRRVGNIWSRLIKMENKNFARVLPCFYLKISPEVSGKFVNLLFFLCGSSKGGQNLVKAHKNGK